MSYNRTHLQQYSELGLVYAGAVYAPSTSSTYPRATLFNPVANTKNLKVFRCAVEFNSGNTPPGDIYVGYQNTVPSGSSYSRTNQLIGGPVSTANFIASTDSSLSTPNAMMFMQFNTYEIYEFLMDHNSYIIIPPGNGLYATCSTQNAVFRLLLQWVEE